MIQKSQRVLGETMNAARKRLFLALSQIRPPRPVSSLTHGGAAARPLASGSLAAPWSAVQTRGIKLLSTDVSTPADRPILCRFQFITSTVRVGNVIQRKGTRAYARDRPQYNVFGNKRPGDEEFRKAWAKDVDEEDCLWTGSDEDEGTGTSDSKLEKEIKKVKVQARENADIIDADDSDELRSICPSSDEERVLWSGTECDDDDDIGTAPHPNERSDPHIDKLFEFEETPKYRTIAELLKAEDEPPELSPGKQARKLAVENALKKLKKGPDGRYTNVWEVISDIDILIGAFENIISGPEYAELRAGGPKKLNMQFFKDIQTRMRDPNFKFSPEINLKPKSKIVPKKKWQKAQSRRRKSERR